VYFDILWLAANQFRGIFPTVITCIPSLCWHRKYTARPPLHDCSVSPNASVFRNDFYRAVFIIKSVALKSKIVFSMNIYHDFLSTSFVNQVRIPEQETACKDFFTIMGLYKRFFQWKERGIKGFLIDRIMPKSKEFQQNPENSSALPELFLQFGFFLKRDKIFRVQFRFKHSLMSGIYERGSEREKDVRCPYIIGIKEQKGSPENRYKPHMSLYKNHDLTRSRTSHNVSMQLMHTRACGLSSGLKKDESGFPEVKKTYFFARSG
jgi:hypothetical protein